MSSKKNKNFFIDVGPYPFQIYYSPTPKAFKKFLKEFELPKIKYVNDNKAGSCTIFTHPDFDTKCIITFNPPKHVDEAQIIGIIVHEATHAVDYLIDEIGESCPGKEFRAYTTQHITQQIYSIWKGLN